MERTDEFGMEIKPKKKIGRLGVIIGCLAICAFLVSAVIINYFGSMQQQVIVNKAVEMSGEGCIEGDCGIAPSIVGGESLLSPEYTLASQTSVDIPVKLVTTVLNEAEEQEEGIEIKYVGIVELTQKVVIFGENHWAILEGGNTATVKYSFVDDVFAAEVTEGQLEGYVLIYYKDNSDRFDNPALAIRIEDVEGDLPYLEDGNKEEYDMCTIEGYDLCHGAKIWYVPEDAINTDDSINWGMADDFLFETNLIKYFANADNEIEILPGDLLDFYTETSFSTANTGIYEITTELQVE